VMKLPANSSCQVAKKAMKIEKAEKAVVQSIVGLVVERRPLLRVGESVVSTGR
jgi:hypothetical protein